MVHITGEACKPTRQSLMSSYLLFLNDIPINQDIFTFSVCCSLIDRVCFAHHLFTCLSERVITSEVHIWSVIFPSQQPNEIDFLKRQSVWWREDVFGKCQHSCLKPRIDTSSDTWHFSRPSSFVAFTCVEHIGNWLLPQIWSPLYVAVGNVSISSSQNEIMFTDKQ